MKVRLKPEQIRELELRVLGFNSMKVRLKRVSIFGNGKFLLFQFHEGPIKTWSQIPGTIGFERSFNSMKVRLKRGC